MNLELLTQESFLKQYGISDWGYIEGEVSLESQKRFESWQQKNKTSTLKYLLDERGEKRKSLTSFYHEYHSALVFTFSYRDIKKTLQRKNPFHPFKIASYALAFSGKDYHQVLRTRLESLASRLGILPQERIFSIDAQPVLERDLAYRAGLGWFGKNSMLISPKQGSYFLIGALLLAKKLPLLPSQFLESDHCGHCRLCIDACPTKAIDEQRRTLNADRCISTYTIEVFQDTPPFSEYSSTGEIFGCDICQEVCPWNTKPLFHVSEKKIGLENSWDLFKNKNPEEILEHLKSLSKRSYRKIFKETCLERTGRDGMIKNIKALTKKFF